MATQVLDPQTNEQSLRKTLVDWITAEMGDGDLDTAVDIVIGRIEQEELISGPLWDELKHWLLRTLWRKDEGSNSRRTERRAAAPQSEEDAVYAEWHKVGERYFNLGDMTKADCWVVSDHYNDLVLANGAKRDFLAALAEGMKEKQTVRQRYTPEEITALKKQKGDA